MKRVAPQEQEQGATLSASEDVVDRIMRGDLPLNVVKRNQILAREAARMPPHWYFITVCECPVCGRGPTIRERRYDPKPEYHADRYEYQIRYDYCNW